MGQLVLGFGGSGLGQALAAVAAALLLRLFSGPGPALFPDSDLADDDDGNDVINDEGEYPVAGNVIPVTIRWRNLTCSLSDKSSKSVSSFKSLKFSKWNCSGFVLVGKCEEN